MLQIVLLMSVHVSMAQVEMNPNSPNVGLEIISQSKGLLLPRINKPTDVNPPKEGLMIYNKESKTPAFHDGTNWRMVNSSSVSNTNNSDSITYTIVTPFSHLTAGTNILGSIAIAGLREDLIRAVTFQMSKPRDAKTIEFLKFFHDDKANGSNTLVMEVKVFKKGVSTPYFSYKFKKIKLLVYNFSDNNSGNNPIESYTIESKMYGWWDYINNFGVAYDLTNGSPTPINYNTGF